MTRSLFYFFALIGVVALSVVPKVLAEDYRLYFNPPSGESLDEFCAQWSSTCPTVVTSHDPNATSGQVYEPAPPGSGAVAQAFCNANDAGVVTQYANEVASDLGATPVP
ncbi:hypothetical protein BOTBODRAFT_65265 [Botryobasidium botryosum FD-172 SS1]|uniref:Uncharacterized protein n=1 Tax=Botryobasidium botryosum (strain FD-172 SS1) TaxID=930990 RepID=A0A067MJ31_BOTB1|nr:hypothetical protein BOTBODRAFT_65265 [Botryobasidium botryosum FD-172 SS1]